jgi:hypothetical protein
VRKGEMGQEEMGDGEREGSGVGRAEGLMRRGCPPYQVHAGGKTGVNGLTGLGV